MRTCLDNIHHPRGKEVSFLFYLLTEGTIFHWQLNRSNSSKGNLLSQLSNVVESLRHLHLKCKACALQKVIISFTGKRTFRLGDERKIPGNNVTSFAKLASCEPSTYIALSERSEKIVEFRSIIRTFPFRLFLSYSRLGSRPYGFSPYDGGLAEPSEFIVSRLTLSPTKYVIYFLGN